MLEPFFCHDYTSSFRVLVIIKISIRQVNKTDKAAKNPKLSFTNPSNGRIIAPPETPIIINAEISLDRSGSFFSAKEKIIEKTFAQDAPTIKTRITSNHKFETNINAIKEAIAMRSENRRKRRGRIFNSSIAPTKVPIVFAAKYTLLPKPALLSSNPTLLISNSGAVVLIPTSSPTINMILRKQYKMYLSFSKLKTLLNELCEELNPSSFV